MEIKVFIPDDRFIGRQCYALGCFRDISQTPNLCDRVLCLFRHCYLPVVCFQLVIQGPGKCHDTGMGHAEQKIICLGIKQDGASYFIGPEIIVGNTPQACFNTSQHNGYGLFKKASHKIGVYNDRPVRPAVVFGARRVVILFAPFF